MAALFYTQFYIPFAEIQVQQTASPCCMLVQLAYFLRGGSLHNILCCPGQALDVSQPSVAQIASHCLLRALKDEFRICCTWLAICCLLLLTGLHGLHLYVMAEVALTPSIAAGESHSHTPG